MDKVGKVFVSTLDKRSPVFQSLVSRIGEFAVASSSPDAGDWRGNPQWDSWYSSRMQEEISSADLFVAINTPGYITSTWMRAELGVASMTMPPNRIFLYSQEGGSELMVEYFAHVLGANVVPEGVDVFVGEGLVCWPVVFPEVVYVFLVDGVGWDRGVVFVSDVVVAGDEDVGGV